MISPRARAMEVALAKIIKSVEMPCFPPFKRGGHPFRLEEIDGSIVRVFCASTKMVYSHQHRVLGILPDAIPRSFQSIKRCCAQPHWH
jgi:hypothetical protein